MPMHGIKRSRYISPGSIALYLLVLAFGSLGFYKSDQARSDLASAQRQFVGSARTGCLRTNVTNTALLDLGKIITLARDQTVANAAARKASIDFIAQVKRIDPHSPTGMALKDIAIILGGDKGKPNDPTALLAAEADYIARAKKIEKPRRCGVVYNVKKVPG